MNDMTPPDTSQPLIPAHIAEIFGPPPVIQKKHVPFYDRLLAGLVTELEPSSMLEWLAVKELADLSWEILQMSQFRAASFQAGADYFVRHQEFLTADGGPVSADVRLGSAIDRAIGTVVLITRVQDSFARRRDALLLSLAQRRARRVAASTTAGSAADADNPHDI